MQVLEMMLFSEKASHFGGDGIDEVGAFLAGRVVLTEETVIGPEGWQAQNVEPPAKTRLEHLLFVRPQGDSSVRLDQFAEQVKLPTGNPRISSGAERH
jgi:hypothetical protein